MIDQEEIIVLPEEWITVDNIYDEFGTPDSNSGEYPLIKNDLGEVVVNEKRISECITSARLKIETYLRASGVQTPATLKVRQELRECIFNITRYYYTSFEQGGSENITERYEKSMEYLKSIASGKIRLSSASQTVGIFNFGFIRG